jgi:long-chain acyl-CoA synthetase
MPETGALSEVIRAEIEGATILGGFLDTAAAAPDDEALRWKESGQWVALTWREYRQQVAEVTAGLAALGLARGECVLMLSRNRPEPHIADLAVQAAGAVPVSLHTTLTADQVAGIGNHCEASMAFVDDADALTALTAVRGRIPSLRAIVVFDDAAGAVGDVLTWSQLRQDGARSVGDAQAALASAASKLSSDDLATLIYTSGTTGAPKGVMIAHSNVRWVTAAGFRDEPPSTGERFISYLPFSTVGGRFVDHWGHVVLGGAVIHFCPDPAQLWDYAAEVRPTLLLGVPAIWEKLSKDIVSAIDRIPDGKRRTIVHDCVEVGRQVARFKAAGMELPEGLAGRVAKVQPILRSLLGLVGLDQCKAGVSGGAPIDTEIVEFFRALGLPMTVSWGMTELTSAVTAGGPNGSVGTPYPGVEIKPADDGEILVRGGLTMKGYYRDPEQTAEVLDAEGWLRTGDLGAVDDAGNLRIVGRKKDIIVAATGMNIAPDPIELLLERNPLIGQALAAGDRQRYVTALITLDPDVAPRWAAEHGLTDTSAEALAASPEVLAEVRRALDQANTLLGAPERVLGFHVLAAPWTTESGELTPTLKKRREAILQRYAAEIAGMYAEP